jgi:large subunit ribosomal protein L29
MLRISEIRALTDAQLRQNIEELNEELFSLRFQRASYKTVNPARFGQIKKNIAQIKTVLREREIDALIAETEQAARA